MKNALGLSDKEIDILNSLIESYQDKTSSQPIYTPLSPEYEKAAERLRKKELLKIVSPVKSFFTNKPKEYILSEESLEMAGLSVDFY